MSTTQIDQKDLHSAFDRFKSTSKPAVAPASTVTAAKKPIQAFLNHTSAHVCPYCQLPMVKTRACDQVVFLCPDDRHVSPLPNAELSGEMALSTGGTPISPTFSE